jgi:DNA helicase-2/ATP-dependent DNA helicase PcrA
MLGLNKSQQKAASQTSGSVLVLAGPGTGKTRVIISKVEHCLQAGLTPESILAVTFSRKATQEMEDRLSELNPSIAQRMQISTLHSLCADIVQRHGYRLGFQKAPRLMSEAEAYVFFKKVSARLPLQNLLKTSHIDPIIDDLLAFFSDAKDEGLWPEAILRYAESLSDETPEEQLVKEEWQALGDIYNAYQSFCFEKGLMDFGDCILCALKILENFPVVREEIQKQYRAILIDEFQDTNWSQIQLLRYLAAPDCHVMAVGDDDQSIYRFRGASYSAFQFFEDFFPGTEVIELSETYRLPPKVLEVASELIAANGEHRFRPDKKIASSHPDTRPVQWIKASSYEDEAKFICDKIEEIIQGGGKYNEIGILVRAHAHADLFLSEAHKRKLPIRTGGSKNFFASEIIRDVFAFLKLCVDPEDSVALLRLFDSYFLELSAEDTFKFCKSKNFKGPLIAQLENLKDCPVSAEAKIKLEGFYKNYQQSFSEAATKNATQTLLSYYEHSNLIQTLLGRAPEELRTLGRFHSELVKWESTQTENHLRALFPILESIQTQEFALDSEASEVAADAISLLTVHASKGLEFEHVFIPSLVGRRFPSAFRQNLWLVPNALRKEESPTKESHTHEERRLLYVAMTRAKKSLYLLGVEKKGTKPSFFVSEDLKKTLKNSETIQTINLPPQDQSEIPKSLESKPFSRIEATAGLRKKSVDALSLSFTQLEKYENCPLSYQFKYEFQIPVAIPAHMHVGSAIHKALELFFQRVKKGKVPGKEELLTLFDETFHGLREENPELTDFHFNQGRTRLAAYYDFHQGNFPFPHAIEEEFVLPFGPHRIRGKIDRIDKTNEGYRIVDYKTGRAKSNDNPDDVKFARDSLQFSIYALAAREILKLDVTELIFDYIYENKTLSTSRSDQDLKIVKERITQIADDIIAQKFEAKVGRQCDWCEYRRICPAI